MSARVVELVDAVCAAAVGIPGDVSTVVGAEVDRLAPLATRAERSAAIAQAIARLDGLGSIEGYLADPSVDEVMINRGREVWVERASQLRHVEDLPAGAIDGMLERVLAAQGKRLDRTHPVVDTHLVSGARLCAVVAPLAVDGTTVSIRRHRPHEIDVGDMANGDVLAVVDQLLDHRCNVLITGATSTGKTTLLSGLIRRLPPGERVIVVEDTTEIDIERAHVVRLEARPATADYLVDVPMIDLVRTALRLRPDRLIVGEFRGDEVLAMVQALNTGHDGSWSTCHAHSCVDAIARVETLVMQAAPSWPLVAIRQQVTRSIDAIVHLRRLPDGRRHIDEIAEVVEIGDSTGSPRVRVVASGGVVVAGLTRSRR